MKCIFNVKYVKELIHFKNNSNNSLIFLVILFELMLRKEFKHEARHPKACQM